jgi:hypothetical protein
LLVGFEGLLVLGLLSCQFLVLGCAERGNDPFTRARARASVARPMTSAVSTSACGTGSLTGWPGSGAMGSCPRVRLDPIRVTAADCEIRAMPTTTRTRSRCSNR